MLRRFLRFSSFALLVCSALSCGGDGGNGPSGNEGPLRVLFIGNSLTYTNDLPGMVEALATASGETIETDEVTYANFALLDHWETGEAKSMVNNGNYDYVIMQQGPSSLPVNADSLRIWAEMWAPLIRERGGTPAMYAVWPEEPRSYAFPAVSDAYHNAAIAINGLFLPVGDTWLETWRLNPSAPLYGPDRFHPGVAGTYAAAVVIVSMLTHRSAIGLATAFDMPSSIVESLDSGVASDIRQAADAVINRNGGYLRR